MLHKYSTDEVSEKHSVGGLSAHSLASGWHVHRTRKNKTELNLDPDILNQIVTEIWIVFFMGHAQLFRKFFLK